MLRGRRDKRDILRARSPFRTAAARRDARCEAATATDSIWRASVRSWRSCRLHKAKRRLRRLALLQQLRRAGQVEMRRTIAGAVAARVPAKGDRLAFRVAAVRIAAVIRLQ